MPSESTVKDPKLIEALVGAQRNELTECHVYRSMAGWVKDPATQDLLGRIAQDEKDHYDYLEQHTGQRPKPYVLVMWFYIVVARIMGITFAAKLMERGEERAERAYEALVDVIPDAQRLVEEEEEHEQQMLGLIDEERLKYVGSFVLGLSDALVELTGALAGMTLALQDTRLIALIGLITGIAASMSMAASEYLSVKHDEADEKAPLKASVYTGIAYIFTVALLVAPYLLLSSAVLALVCTLVVAMLIVAFFTFYTAIAQDQSFKGRFFEMAALCLGISALSFAIGFGLRHFMGVDV